MKRFLKGSVDSFELEIRYLDFYFFGRAFGARFFWEYFYCHRGNYLKYIIEFFLLYYLSVLAAAQTFISYNVIDILILHHIWKPNQNSCPKFLSTPLCFRESNTIKHLNVFSLALRIITCDC